ncbi:SAM-dependent methyltransferase [candidate division WOR-3 bacterium 4484_100]|uniref:SAM-dependent methyltransferase n=1 Tax=candidate division WOR-3 bacterium 4484_100 TaxID=1936077 RepID=A0A1V4QE04_UNCW3|nr:MAG: SAM-dependent methyltransferase [candidate division WOR-3 bacterium 4484_100]
MTNIFDIYTEEYDNWFLENHYAYLSELIALKEAIPDSKLGIEIGVGTGRFSSMLNIRYGVDLSYNSLKLARERGCEVVLAPAENLPFSSNTFDYALLMVTLCFVDEPERTLKEARRILKKGGKLIVGIIDRDSRLGKLYQKKKSKFYQVARFFSSLQVIELMRRSRFRRISASQTLFDDIEKIEQIDQTRDGFGEGSFVVLSGVK